MYISVIEAGGKSSSAIRLCGPGGGSRYVGLAAQLTSVFFPGLNPSERLAIEQAPEAVEALNGRDDQFQVIFEYKQAHILGYMTGPHDCSLWLPDGTTKGPCAWPAAIRFWRKRHAALSLAP